MSFATAVTVADVEARLDAGDPAGALRLADVLAAARPGDAGIALLRGRALMRSGDARATRGALVAHAGPSAAPALNALFANACLIEGDVDAALVACRDALAARPDDFALRLQYAESLDAARHADAALVEYFRAVITAQGRGRWLGDDTTAPGLRERVRRAMDIIDGGRRAMVDDLLRPHRERFGAQALARVVEGLEIYLGDREAPASDGRRPKFLHLPSLPQDVYFDRAHFPWYAALEDASAAIADEMSRVLALGSGLEPFLKVSGTDEEEMYLGGQPGTRAWDGYFFFRHGRRFDEHHAECPATSAALESVPLAYIRDHGPEVLFSVLAPGTHIKPHVGVTNTRLVTHLALRIPPGDCRLSAAGIDRAWEQGRCFTFDDTWLHEAWNRTDETRAVMLADVWNPYLTAEERIVIADVVERIGDFNRCAGLA